MSSITGEPSRRSATRSFTGAPRPSSFRARRAASRVAHQVGCAAAIPFAAGRPIASSRGHRAQSCRRRRRR